MSDFPLVVALIITYERTDVAIETIRGIKDRIHYPNLDFHIADDGSKEGHVAALIAEIGPDYEVTVSNTGGHSVGRSMNMGTAAVLERAHLWLHWEDDWVPNMDIDLVPCVRLLEDDDRIGMIRMGRLHANVSGEVISGGDRLWWMLSEKDEWAWTGHAAMRHKRFHDAYGDYVEGLPPGQTEMTMLDTVNKVKGPRMVWPAWLRYDICDHIGDGYSYKEAMENRLMDREAAAQEFAERIEQSKVKP